MRRRAHRRNLVVWSPATGPGSRYGAPMLARPARTSRIRRSIRIGGLLTVIGLIRLVRAVRLRWRPLLAGVVLTAMGVMPLSGAWGALLFLSGAMFLLFALLTAPASTADRKQRCELERELAAYFTPIQRWDLEATLDRYPDSVTREVRDILASQAMADCQSGIPGGGRPG